MKSFHQGNPSSHDYHIIIIFFVVYGSRLAWRKDFPRLEVDFSFLEKINTTINVRVATNGLRPTNLYDLNACMQADQPADDETNDMGLGIQDTIVQQSCDTQIHTFAGGGP
jgi:hypothetical protein